MDQKQQEEADSQRMTYEEYLKRFSDSHESSDADSDDPQEIAELLAKETVAIFKEALEA